jgi:hypothetical protein
MTVDELKTLITETGLALGAEAKADEAIKLIDGINKKAQTVDEMMSDTELAYGIM